jgi:hypothetical protein
MKGAGHLKPGMQSAVGDSKNSGRPLELFEGGVGTECSGSRCRTEEMK